MIMNNDDKALMKDIADDLNKKSLEELIYINFNPEHYEDDDPEYEDIFDDSFDDSIRFL